MDQMKVVLSTDLRFGYLYFPLIMKRTFHSVCVLTENLNLLPQKHEVNQCTYANPVGDMQLVGYFCISEGFPNSDVFLKFL